MQPAAATHPSGPKLPVLHILISPAAGNDTLQDFFKRLVKHQSASIPPMKLSRKRRVIRCLHPSLSGS